MNFDGISENAHVARSLAELRDDAGFGKAAGGGQVRILRDHPPGAKDPVALIVANLEVLAVVLELIDGGKAVAYLFQALRGIFVPEDELHIFGALLEFVVLGLVDASAQHPQAGQA